MYLECYAMNAIINYLIRRVTEEKNMMLNKDMLKICCHAYSGKIFKPKTEYTSHNSTEDVI